MIYEKRLLVLSGSSASGCLRLEKTDSAVTCYLTGNVKLDCVLVIRDENDFLCFGDFNLGSAYKFSLPAAMKLDSLVAAVGDLDGRLVMSGGFKRPMPWRGNLEDDVRRAIKCLGIDKKQVRDINDFFLDIVPTDYDDSRVAEVNYYRSNLTAEEGEAADKNAAAENSAAAEQPVQNVAPAEPVTATVAAAAPAPAPMPEPAPAKVVLPTPEPPVAPSPAPEPAPVKKPFQKKVSAADEVAGTIAEPPLPESTEFERLSAKIPELAPVSFYDSVKDQVERLFGKNERFENLEKLLPESRWIKVNYDASGKYYLVGVIGDPVRYLCYGVPGEYSPTPPSDLAGYSQWLALDENDPAGKGFWLMYQDAHTGRSVL